MVCIPVVTNSVDNKSLAINSEEKRPIAGVGVGVGDGEPPTTVGEGDEDGDIFDPERVFSDREACRTVSSVRCAVASSSSSSRALQDIVRFALTTIEVKEFGSFLIPRNDHPHDESD